MEEQHWPAIANLLIVHGEIVYVAPHRQLLS